VNHPDQSDIIAPRCGSALPGAKIAGGSPLPRRGYAAASVFLSLAFSFMVMLWSARSRGQAPAPESGSTVPAAGGEIVVPAAGATAGEVVVPVEGSYRYSEGPEIDYEAAPVVRTRNGFEKSESNLVEILESMPGVAVTELGGDEGPWVVSVRGDGGPGAAVYLDGILLNDQTGRVVDLSRIPLAFVDQVVVYRGAAPAGYAVAGTAGVVDIKTRAAGPTLTWDGKASVDSLYTAGAAGVVTGRAFNGSGMAGFSYEGGPSKFSYTDDRGTYNATGDDRSAERTNNAFNDYDVMLKWDRKVMGYRLYTGTYYQQRVHELPGKGYQDGDGAREKSETVLVYVGAKQAGTFNLPDLDTELRVHVLQERFWVSDEKGAIGAPRDDLDLRRRLGLDLYAHYYGLRSNTISLYLGLYNEDYRPESKLDPKVNQISCARSSIYFTAADEIALLDGRLKLKPRVRYAYDGSSYKGNTLAAQAGKADDTSSYMGTVLDVSAGYMIVDGLWVLANMGQHYRPPGFWEEFGNRSDLLGNPDLQSESGLVQTVSLIYDRGPFWRFDTFRAEITYYQNDLSDRIAWVDQGGGVWQADNVGDVRTRGIEAGVSLNVRDLLVLDASYAWQNAVNRADDPLINGKVFPSVPRNTANLTATLYQSYGRIYYKGDYQDIRRLDELNTVRAEPRFVHSMGISYYSERWSLGFEARNIGNDQSREALDYPLPGIRYMIFMEVKG